MISLSSSTHYLYLITFKNNDAFTTFVGVFIGCAWLISHLVKLVYICDSM